jgi:hypothetical protein
MHEILPTKIARSSAEIRRGIAAGEKENAMRGVVPLQGVLEPPIGKGTP